MVKKVKRHEFNKSKGFHNLKASTSQGINIWVFPKMVVPPFHTPKWSFLVGKPIVVGYHHLRKPLYPTKGIIIFTSADWNRICWFRFKKIGPLSEKNDEFRGLMGVSPLEIAQAFNGILMYLYNKRYQYISVPSGSIIFSAQSRPSAHKRVGCTRGRSCFYIGIFKELQTRFNCN